MANSFTQLHVQLIFAVKGRQSLVREVHREELQKYTTGIVQNQGHKLLSIFCRPDHTHIFIGLDPTIAISDAVRDIKSNSSKFINKSGWVRGHFNWQEGFGAFSYSHSAIDDVCQYIQNQAEHHKRISFREEYLELLRRFEIEYDEKYLFEWIEL